MEATELHASDSLSLSFGSSVTSLFHFGSEPNSPSGYSPTQGDRAEQEEEEEENDEYVAELTRRMANYMFQDDDDDNLQKSRGGSGSPQSTLWSPFATGYGSSSIGPSREASPPLTPAVVKFEKMKAKAEVDPVPIPFQSKQALIEDQIRSVKANFGKIKAEKEKEMRERRNRARAATKQYGYGGNNQQNGSGMKAVFLNSRPGSAGTGVFLPRGPGTVSDSGKKKGIGAVMIPERVIEALNLHFHQTPLPLQRKQSYAAALLGATREPPADLPSEWTY